MEIRVSLPKIFRLVENLGLSVKVFDEDLYSIKYRY